MKRSVVIITLAIIACWIFPLSSFAWSGKCVAVTDGDTIKVMHESTAEKIRLYGIDCPERKQPFGTKAKQFAAALVFGNIVEVKPLGKDRYGRTIAWVYVNDVCLNEELLKAGLAWHYKRYSKEKNFAILEAEARSKKIGLWSDNNPIPPWQWRRSH